MQNYHTDLLNHFAKNGLPKFKYIINDGSNMNFRVSVRKHNIWKTSNNFVFTTFEDMINGLQNPELGISDAAYVIFCFRKNDNDAEHRKMAKQFNKTRKSNEKVCVSQADSNYPFEMHLVLNYNKIKEAISKLFNLYGDPKDELEYCRYGATLRGMKCVLKQTYTGGLKCEHSIFLKDKSDVSTILLVLGDCIARYSVIEHFQTWEALDQKYNVTDALKNKDTTDE